MRHSRKKQKGARAAPKDAKAAVNLQRARATQLEGDDSEAIERAVYDGMQDLRATRKDR
jgi:hypothetical protein